MNCILEKRKNWSMITIMNITFILFNGIAVGYLDFPHIRPLPDRYIEILKSKNINYSDTREEVLNTLMGEINIIKTDLPSVNTKGNGIK